jgi:thioester reductase-like protein
MGPAKVSLLAAVGRHQTLTISLKERGKNMNIFLTGCTGLLGGEFLMDLSKRSDVSKIYCLVRAANEVQADERLEKVFGVHDDYYDRGKVIPIVGDLASSEVLIEKLNKIDRLKSVDAVIHSAADTSFAPSHMQNIHRVNVTGSGNIARWAADLPRLETFLYVGTAWIRGCDHPRRVVYEDESPNMDYNQLVEYCRSKTIGEINVRKLIPAEKLLVVRPSSLTGDSRSWTPRKFVIDWCIATFNLLRLVAMEPDAACDLIPVDWVSKAIVELLFAKRHFGVYHISAGVSSTNMGTLLNAISANYNRPAARFVDYELLKQMQLFSRGRLPNDASLRDYQEHLQYWKSTFNSNGDLRKLLWAIKFYYQFVNLGLVFDNTRLLQDTTVGLPEPAHIYLARNRTQLDKIDIMGEADNP